MSVGRGKDKLILDICLLLHGVHSEEKCPFPQRSRVPRRRIYSLKTLSEVLFIVFQKTNGSQTLQNILFGRPQLHTSLFSWSYGEGDIFKMSVGGRKLFMLLSYFF